MDMDAHQLTLALGGRWHGRYGTAVCPAHPDKNPSLTVRDGAEAVLLTCHAHCSSLDIIEALRRRGLWPDRPTFGKSTPVQPRRRQPEPPPDQNTEAACRIWRAAVPLWKPEAEPARLYLTSRGIAWPWPETLRFSRLRHSETRETTPALVVPRHDPRIGTVRGIQHPPADASTRVYGRLFGHCRS